MNVKKIAISVVMVVGVMVVGVGLVDVDRDGDDDPAFHVMLARPDVYVNGVYSEEIILDGGEYSFSFVPNGDSPEVLGISLYGETFSFAEDFELVGTLHQTGISEYHTWDYHGQKILIVPDREHISIEIDPNGNIMGAVSINMIKK